MNFNINFSKNSEYNLQESLIHQMINLYGVEIKLLLTEKVNRDDNIFGDFSHMKTNKKDTFLMYALPEESEDFSTDGYSFSPFGMNSFDNIVLFVSKKSLMLEPFITTINNIETIDFRKIMSQLIIFPNNKIMEITDVDPCVPGINNLFTYENAKSVYKVTCVPYTSKLIQEVKSSDIVAPKVEIYDFSATPEIPRTDDEDVIDFTNEFDEFDTTETEELSELEDNYNTLDEYFEKLENIKVVQDDEVSKLSDYANVIFNVPNSDKNKDDTYKTILVDKSEVDVWGNNA